MVTGMRAFMDGHDRPIRFEGAFISTDLVFIGDAVLPPLKAIFPIGHKLKAVWLTIVSKNSFADVRPGSATGRGIACNFVKPLTRINDQFEMFP